MWTDVQAGFRKSRDQTANICGIIEKGGESRKTPTSASSTILKPLTMWITTNWKIPKEIGIPDNLTWVLRNLYVAQEETVRTLHGTTDLFKSGEGLQQGCILCCLFNVYVEYIMWNVELDKSQVGIKIARRDINNLRYAHDTTLMAESEEELKSFLMRVK